MILPRFKLLLTTKYQLLKTKQNPNGNVYRLITTQIYECERMVLSILGQTELS